MLVLNTNTKLFLFCIYCILLMPYAMMAEGVHYIDGYVYDTESGKQLAGANILLEELNRGTVSDENGKFRFENTPSGTYTLSVSFIGYELQKKLIDTATEDYLIHTFAMNPVILKGQSIRVSATRAIQGETPVTFSNLSGDYLRETYTVSDVPMMLNELPGVYAYSLTGDNLGYSFLKIRGFDQRRIGVMINDIPLNDPEDHEVYWVDLPDLVESIEDIQVQRGVGSSIYGSSTFGGSVNIKTDTYSDQQMSKITMGAGSFNTRKYMAEYKSGLIQNSYAFYSRFSKISSDGYRRSSSSDLLAYFFGLQRYDRNMVTTINIFNGMERTHPDWDGIPADILLHDRRYKKETYENAVDDFSQPHYQFMHEWQVTPLLNLSNTLYYIHGEGYYENLKTEKKLSDYGMNNFLTSDPALFGADSLSYYETESGGNMYKTNDGNYLVERTDLVRQKWVDKNQYGWISKMNYQTEGSALTLGSSIYTFDSNHFGKVLWANNIPAIYDADRKYYGNSGYKFNASFFLNYLYKLTPEISLFSNLLYEHKNYIFKQAREALFVNEELNRYKVRYDFLSPRAGVNYKVNKYASFYGNISYAQREPSDTDLFDQFTGPDDLGADPLFKQADSVRINGRTQYIKWRDPIIDPESVVDYEAGVHFDLPNLTLDLNVYYMNFANEIVPLGAVDKDGIPVRGNADNTIHKGIEFSFRGTPSPIFRIDGNISYSKNTFEKYVQKIIVDWDSYEVGTSDLSGNNIAGFPTLIGNLKVSGNWRALNGSAGLRYVGKQYLDNTENKDRIIEAFKRVDFNLSYQFKHLLYFSGIRLNLSVLNVLNEEYETAGYYDSWADVAYFYPGADRNYYLGLSFDL